MNGRYRKAARVCLVFALAVAVSPATGLELRAALYMPLDDEDLLRQASLVVHARILQSRPSPTERAATSSVAQILSVLKGRPPGRFVAVSVPGGPGTSLWVPGAPEFEPGDEVVVFLSPGRDGSYQITQLFLGAFYRVRLGGADVAVRRVGDAVQVSRPGRRRGEELELREFSRFTRWLGDRSRGSRRPDDYFLSRSEVVITPEVSESLMVNRSGNFARWFEFDGGEAVVWHALESGLPQLPGGGFSEFQAALAAWSEDAGVNIHLQYGGTAPSGSGFTARDGVNAIHFDDPHNEIAGSFSCSTGGVLAIGGFWYTSSTMEWNGATFNRIVEGEVVTQDGASCFFALHDGRNGEETFAHELGHTLGFGHSCADSESGSCNTVEKDEALMRAFAHGDGRGADPRAYDRDMAVFSYGSLHYALLDLDMDLRIEALTDGVLVLRFLFGFSGSTLVEGATSPNGLRWDADEIEAVLMEIFQHLDIDGDGRVEALSDGLLLLRYLFGFRGSPLISGALSPEAARNTAGEIEAYIEDLLSTEAP